MSNKYIEVMASVLPLAISRPVVSVWRRQYMAAASLGQLTRMCGENEIRCMSAIKINFITVLLLF